MIPKPSACHGCPFYGDGKGFVPDIINDQAEVFIYAQNPGASEESGERWTGTSYEPFPPQPLIGKTGLEMERTYLPQAGLERAQVSLGNALRCRYKHRDALPPLKSVIVREALEHCHKAHFKLPAKTKIISVQGEYALYAMTQEGMDKYRKISDWRGYALPYRPLGVPRVVDTEIFTPTPADIVVLASYHIAYTFRDPIVRLVTKSDWHKIRKVLNGKWPVKLPAIKSGPPSVWPTTSAFDTEFVPTTRHFICYSLYDGRTLRVSEELNGGITDTDNAYTVIMHNAVVDIPFLHRMLPPNAFRILVEDTMFSHSVLWSDFDHDLGFLGSLYSSLNKWKHLDRLNPKMYSAADAFATWEAFEQLKKELQRDPGSQYVYEIQKKLIPIIMASEERGIRVNPARSKEAYLDRLHKVEKLRARAEAIVGWPINLASNPQVGHHLFKVEGLLKLVENVKPHG